MFKDGYEQIYKLEEIANQIVVKKSQKHMPSQYFISIFYTINYYI